MGGGAVRACHRNLLCANRKKEKVNTLGVELDEEEEEEEDTSDVSDVSSEGDEFTPVLAINEENDEWWDWADGAGDHDADICSGRFGKPAPPTHPILEAE